MNRKLSEVFKEVKFSNREIVEPYIIAEAGVNHEGSMELAKRLIYEAAEGGADAIKFQTYKADKIASRESPYYWDLSKEPTRSQFELFQKYDSFWKNEFESLKVLCDEVGIEFMSTPFDVESATFLNDLMTCFKISSSDLTNKPFIQFMCKFQKPVILSTGASNLWEIEQTVGWIEEFGNPLSILHCVLNYPTPDENAHLGMILHLKEKFPEYIIGYSDHTLPADMLTMEIATLLGAKIIEKHFSHDKTLPGNDHYHAMDKEDLKLFNNRFARIRTLLGDFEKRALDEEKSAIKNARRSLVSANRIAKGTKLQLEDLTFKRPAFGVSPRFIGDVVGMIARRDIEPDEIIRWGMLDDDL